MRGSVWKPEHDNRMRELWGKSYSASQISADLWREFHISFSRNAVCGRLRRTGLSRPKKLGPPVKRVKATRPHAEPRSRARSTPFLPPMDPAEIRLRCVEVIPRNLTLLDLEPNDCRYPYGDSSFMFCGHPKMDGSSYCPAHFDLTLRDKRGQHEATPANIARLKQLTRSTREVLNMAIVDGEIGA